LAALIFTIICLANSYHIIKEGSVGIYYVQGRLQETLAKPGVNWAKPFITEVEEITTRPRTDKLEDVSTVTKDGITNVFHSITVISDVQDNRIIPLIKRYGTNFRKTLVFDRIKEELRLHCANHTIDEIYNTQFLKIVGNVKTRVEESISRLGENGIQILNLVIPKPEIPQDIAANYQKVKVQWTEGQVAIQRQKTEKIKKKIEEDKAVADADRLKKVQEIDIQKNIAKKEGDKKIAILENEIVKLREENKANVEFYVKQKAAEANKQLFTKEYVQLQLAKSLSNNTKLFFSGESSPLGAVFAKIFGQGQ